MSLPAAARKEEFIIALVTLRELNRATLARQMLLERHAMKVPKAVAHLLGLQAQLPRPPFIGLWTRLEGLARADVARAIESKAVVRATAMRGTIHLMAAADFLAFRSCLQDGLDAGLHAILRERAGTIDFPRLRAAALAYFRSPHNFEDARAHLARAFPGGDVRALGYAARLGVPLVQVPGGDAWSFPARAGFVSAETWLGKPVTPAAPLDRLVLRYLAAYGPATAKDAQAWLGVAGLDAVFEALSSKLARIDAGKGKPLYDLPDAPRPDADTPAPVRFLPEWDSAIVTRADERFVARAHRPRVFLPGLRVAALVLVDGVAAATWKIAATSRKATLQVEAFGKWTAAIRREVESEGQALLRFVEPDVTSYDFSIELP